MFFNLLTYAFVFGLHTVVMITCNSIHISQEIFAIDVLTALNPFWDCWDYMETRLKLTNVKNSFSGVITSRYCLRSFAGSPISIILSHKFESNTVPGSGPGS